MDTLKNRPIDENFNVELEAIELEPTFYDDEEDIINGEQMPNILLDSVGGEL